MATFLTPAIKLLNKLRFKYKFVLLAAVFYIPLLASFIWLVVQQTQSLNERQMVFDGYQNYELVVDLEDKLSELRVDNIDYQAAYSSWKSVSAKLNKVVLNQQLDLYNELLEKGKERLINGNFEQYDEIYAYSLAIREQVAAKAGLTRVSDPQLFYLNELTLTKLPALIEYSRRLQDLVAVIIAQGFDAESYTLVVALNKRVDEIQLQLSKSISQLSQLQDKPHKSLILITQTMIEKLDDYQRLIAAQVIEPDDISMTSTQAQRLSLSMRESLSDVRQKAKQAVEQRIEQLIQQSKQLLWTLVALLLVVTVISIYLLTAIYSSILGNVEKLNIASSQMGDGDFSTAISVDSKDEFGDISNSFNLMQAKVNQLIVSFSQQVDSVRNAAGDIHQLTDEMLTSVETQQQETHDVARSVEQVNQSVGTIGSNTENAKEITTQADAKVEDGQTIIVDTGSTIRQIANEVNTSAQVINDLADHSCEIGKFVDVIREIAEQTNLLALNAAIEAARAGEQGRGFAVVADEVRTLASRTQDSTAEIQRIIEQLQSGAERSVSAMKVGVEQAQAGVEKTEGVQSTFDDITQDVSHIVAATLEISAAVTQQREMVQGINESTANIALGADQILKAANNAAIEGQNLSQLADNLSEQLSQFTLNR